MNDRYKYRIFYNNKMVYPNDYQSIESIYECLKQQIMWDCAIDVDFRFNHIANNLVFMQCTGLKDKNGKLIYEGDIVDINITRAKWVVTWFRNRFILVPTDEYSDKDKIASERKSGYYYFENNNRFACERDEVIGNIYENPELLKECENERS